MKTFLILMILTVGAAAQQLSDRPLLDLRGTWKFEIGDNRSFADPAFDDRAWTEVFVPADWENEGFPGYDGYAWYRKTITIPSSAKEKQLYLSAGYVDDACAVYVNGTLIGEGGSLPPQYETAYDVPQVFRLPASVLRYDRENVIAIRVFDEHLNGGIVKGKIGIYEVRYPLRFAVTLPDVWKFKTGDDPEWSSPSADDRKWQTLTVPAKWDIQGFKNYDGPAWYRVSFDVPSSLPDDDYVVVLGRIDDVDETFLNGKKIGSTGRIRSDGTVRRLGEEYRELRGYEISSAALIRGGKNILAVRVYDGFKDGGIYEGPVGIVRKKEFTSWLRNVERSSGSDNPVEKILDKIFNK